jgi:hypothetical protein
VQVVDRLEMMLMVLMVSVPDHRQHTVQEL